MSTYTQILYQIVFSTKNRERSLSKSNRGELFKYISGILSNKKCHLYCINGVEDHLHIITHIHPTIALSKLIKDVKLATSHYIKERSLFPNFNGWQNGYAAFTYSIDAKQNLIDYVMNQEEHHQNSTYKDELSKLLSQHYVQFDPKYLL